MEVWKHKLVVPCKEGNHEIILKVEKHFDSMRQDSDFVLLCEDETNGIEIIPDENNPPEWWE